MKLSIKYLAICALLLLFCGCPDETIQPSTNPLHLTVEETTCTEAFLRISLAENESSRTVTLKRDDSTIATITMVGNDSLFGDEGLLPKKTYTYTLTAQNFNVTAQATTMDTTSHDWTWQLDTLGESGSYLVDVAIINDTLAYAVGEIHIGDSLYNAAKWDGKKWKLMKILFYTICGQENRTPYPASSVIAFSSNDIWFAMNGSQIARWNGNTQTATMCLPVSFSINKIWGNSSNSVYAVGYNGSEGIILYYNGNSWQMQESGTTLGLSDINGTSSNQLYACGLHYGQAKGIVLKKTGETWETVIEGDIIDSTKLFNPKLFGITEGLWVDEKNMLYTVGNLMYCNRSGIWSLVKSLAGNNFTGNPNFLHRGYLHAIDGNASNDVIIVGEINTVRHFNGVTWTQIGLPYQPLNYEMFWYGCNVKKDVMIAVGKAGGRATILTAKR